MDVSGYTADDLEVFRRVLDRAVSEADSGMPVELMARRLFVAARAGERDPDRLVAAVLGHETPPPLPRKFLRSAPTFPSHISHDSRSHDSR
jgi:hypothetical protein